MGEFNDRKGPGAPQGPQHQNNVKDQPISILNNKNTGSGRGCIKTNGSMENGSGRLPSRVSPGRVVSGVGDVCEEREMERYGSQERGLRGSPMRLDGELRVNTSAMHGMSPDPPSLGSATSLNSPILFSKHAGAMTAGATAVSFTVPGSSEKISHRGSISTRPPAQNGAGASVAGTGAAGDGGAAGAGQSNLPVVVDREELGSGPGSGSGSGAGSGSGTGSGAGSVSGAGPGSGSGSGSGLLSGAAVAAGSAAAGSSGPTSHDSGSSTNSSRQNSILHMPGDFIYFDLPSHNAPQTPISPTSLQLHHNTNTNNPVAIQASSGQAVALITQNLLHSNANNINANANAGSSAAAPLAQALSAIPTLNSPGHHHHYHHLQDMHSIHPSRRQHTNHQKAVIGEEIDPPVPFTQYFQKDDDKKIHILIGATGSVATMKVPLIIDKLFKLYTPEKVSIQLVVTKRAEHFLKGLKVNKNVVIWRDENEWIGFRKMGEPVLHVELRKWADIFLVAPLSANTLAKVANGICDNLLTSLLRVWNPTTPVLVAPAMNTFMYTHPVTKKHLLMLQEDAPYIQVLKPVEKVLVCGDIGMGGMREWIEIVEILIKSVSKIRGTSADISQEKEDDDDDEDDDEERRPDDEDEDDDDEDDDDEDDDDEDDNDGDNAHNIVASDGQNIS